MSKPVTVALIHPSLSIRCDNCGSNDIAAYRVVWDDIAYNYCEPCESAACGDETDIALVRDMTDLLNNLDMSDMARISDLLDQTRKSDI